jgi:hypothetical protein
VNETQEDRYYRTKAAFEEVLNIPIDIMQWNNLFRSHIEPHAAELVALKRELAEVRSAMKTLIQFAAKENS